MHSVRKYGYSTVLLKSIQLCVLLGEFCDVLLNTGRVCSVLKGMSAIQLFGPAAGRGDAIAKGLGSVSVSARRLRR